MNIKPTRAPKTGGSSAPKLQLPPLPGVVQNLDQKDMKPRVELATQAGRVLDFEHRLPSASAALSGFPVGHVVEVPLHSLKAHELNARVYYSVAETDEMATSLATAGQKVPVRGYADGDRVILIDGQKRLKGAQSAGLETLRVEICAKPESAVEIYLESRRINEERSAQTPLDDARRFRKLLNEGLVESQASLAQLVKVSEANVSKILALNEIPERVLLQMKERPHSCGLRVAYSVAKLFLDGKKQGRSVDELEHIANDIVMRIADQDLTAKQVEALVDSRLEGPRKRAVPLAENVTYGKGKGVLKMFDAKRQIDLSIKDLSPDQYKELSARLRELFDAKSK